MSNKISEDLPLVLSNLTADDVENYFEMLDSIPEDDDYVFKIGNLVKGMEEEFGLDETGLKAVVIYHLGLLHGANRLSTYMLEKLHGGNNVKT